MYNRTQLASRYIRYYFTALNGRGHGIHSPFVFRFVKEVLNDNRNYYDYSKIESLRAALENEHEELEIIDFGAGGINGQTKTKKVSDITRRTSKDEKLGKLLYRMVHYFKPETIVELGTSMGISSAYISSAHPAGQLYTLEGSPEVVRYARRNLNHIGLKKVQFVEGNFDDTLGPLLANFPQVDFGFIDGNHRYEPTLRYFHEFLKKTNTDSVLVFDDIHWSREMEKAWEQIKNHPSVTMSIDLFFLGIIFFRPEFKVKQHFTIRF